MKSAVCIEPRKIVIKKVEMPTPDTDEVLIRVRSSGICGSDVRAYLGIHPEITYPAILGHEFSGEVVAKGDDVDNVEVGDEVIVEPLVLCGKCRACLSGDYNRCANLIMLGHQIPGSFAEYTIAKSSLVYPKNETLSFDESALIEPLAVAVHAVKRARVSIGDTVAILGAGTIGLLTLQVAKKAGATVMITDISPDKLHLAAGLGADYVVNAESSNPRDLVMAMTDNWGADIVMECAGNTQTLAQTVDLVHKGGTIVAVGWTGNEVDHIGLTKITINEITLLGSIIYCRDFPIAMELAGSGLVDLRSLISHRFEFSRIGEAFRKLAEDQNDIIKAVVVFPNRED